MRRTRRALVGAAGIAATVLLHSLLLAVAVWGGDRFKLHLKQPDAIGAGANKGKPEGEPGERRILVMLTPEFAAPEPAIEPPPQLGIEPRRRLAALQLSCLCRNVGRRICEKPSGAGRVQARPAGGDPGSAIADAIAFRPITGRQAG